MAIQTFTAGQVLTAAQMNSLQANDYNQTVSTKTVSYTLVAADKGTRVVMNSASATTITVNTSLFSAGDTLVLQNIGAGICTVTAGTATVSSAGPLAIPQNGSGTLYFTSTGVSIYFPSAVTTAASGLTLINATTVGAAVSTVTVSNVFSATYDAYLITITGGATSSAAAGFFMNLGSTTTGYHFAYGVTNYSGSVGSPDTGANVGYVNVGFGSPDGVGVSVELMNPFLSKKTIFLPKALVNPTTGAYTEAGGGFLNNNTSYTAFTVVPSGGTLTGQVIRTYGYQNS